MNVIFEWIIQKNIDLHKYIFAYYFLGLMEAENLTSNV